MVFDNPKPFQYIGQLINDIQALLSIANNKHFPVVNIIPFDEKDCSLTGLHYQQDLIKDFTLPKKLRFPRSPDHSMLPLFLFNEIDRGNGLERWLLYLSSMRAKDSSTDIMLNSLLESHLWSPKHSIQACNQVITCLLSLNKQGKNTTISRQIESVLDLIRPALPDCINKNWVVSISNIRNKFTSHLEELMGFTPPGEELFIARKQAYQVCISYICYNVLQISPELIKEYLWGEKWSVPGIAEIESQKIAAWNKEYSNYKDQISSLGIPFS